VAEPKYLGEFRNVMTYLMQEIFKTNEDAEVLSLARAVLHKNADLIPRIYAIPDASIQLKCKASIMEGKVKLFGLGGADMSEEMMEVTINVPIHVVPPTSDQQKIIAEMTEEEVRKRLIERGLKDPGTGSVFVADVEND